MDNSGVAACAGPAASAPSATTVATTPLPHTSHLPLDRLAPWPTRSRARRNYGAAPALARRRGVDLLVAPHDRRDAEAALAGGPARRRIDLPEPADRARHLVLVVDDEARAAVLHDLGRRAL